jgi:hypothetical protein
LISLSTPVLSAKLTIGGVRVALDPSAYSSQAVDSEPGNCCGPFVYSDVAGPKLTGFQLGDSAYLEADGVPSPSIADPIPTTAASITGIGQFFRDGATGGAVLTTAVNFNSSGYVTVSAIPEPETWVMLIAGLGLVGVAARAARGRRAVRPAPGLA